MKYAHLIKTTVFSYEPENNQHVLDAFLRLFPFNLEENKIALKRTTAGGFNEKKIEILEAALMKTSLINQFLENLAGHLDKSQKNQLISQSESRLDKNLDFFIRFDKDSWISEKKLILTDSGKGFHIKISVAAFPKKREAVLNTIKRIFNPTD